MTDVSAQTEVTERVHAVGIDGTAVVFPCAGDDTLLRAALRAGLEMPYECNSGGCGACAVDLVAGEIEDLWPQSPGLSERQRARGKRLACQCRPRGDCVIKVRLRSEPTAVERPMRQLVTLVGREALTHDMAEFHFKASGPARFLPGQYALLDLPGVVGSRAYSMSNLPNEDGLWSFVIKRVPNGRGTAVLFDSLAEGDRIMLDGPFGMAFLRPDSPRDIICIAGGSGLSPVLSILRSAVREPKLNGRRLSLYYGGRTPADLCHGAALGRDAAVGDRVQLVGAISDPAVADWAGERGFIHEVLKRTVEAGGDPKAFDYYFCGPPPMTDAVQRLLMLDWKVPPSQLYFDRFL